MLRRLSSAALLLTGLALSSSSASAQVFNTSFGGSGYSCLNQDVGALACNSTNASRPISYIWTAGDYWRQSISGSGISSLTGLALDLNVRNLLSNGATLTFDVLVNGLTVGTTTTFSPIGDAIITSPFSFSFAAISAAVYDVELRVIPPTVPVGDGSLGLFTDGASTIQLRGAAVPEPGTALLLVIGAAGIAAVRRRRIA